MQVYVGFIVDWKMICGMRFKAQIALFTHLVTGKPCPPDGGKDRPMGQARLIFHFYAGIPSYP